jgi:glycerophosphoryl diester phosphodiesterase
MNGKGVKRILGALAGLGLLLGLLAPACGRAAGPMVIGHRGAAGLLPENTLAAFTRACELGVDAVELDVLASADDVLVVHHEFRLKPEITRGPDGAWIPAGAPPAIRELSLARLKTYDIGRLQPKTGYAGRFPEQAPADGERIPTFAEAIDTFKRACGASTRLFVEVKTTPEEPELTPPPEVLSERVVKMVRDAGIAGRTWILSFDWRNLAHVKKIAPELELVHLTITGSGMNTLKPGQPGASPWLAGMDVDDFGGSAPQLVKAAGGRVWSPFYRNVSAESLEEARRLGLVVSVWTPDSPEDLKRMIDMKVDAITTNRPDVLKKLLANP